MSLEKQKPAVDPRPTAAPAPAGRGWRAQLCADLLEVPGLFALLMKPRNGNPWNADERMLLRAKLYNLSHLSSVLALLVLPGSAVMLPLLAWWLDRRRRPRMSQQ